jgi:serine/threonine-protein kinase
MMPEPVNWVGRLVADGRYQVVEGLDKGRMGHVYRAWDRRLETDVVLKFPVAADATVDEPEFLERFKREIRSLVRLSHPHVVRIIDVGDEQGSPYVVMQYLTGGSLEARMKSGPEGEVVPMTPESLRGWLPDVASALDFMHAQGYIHRDVKPANIMFDQHGHVFVVDFGLIKALMPDSSGKSESALTGFGKVVGTPNYMAPEFVMGLPASGRSDQYSLALTVHEVLTGKPFMKGQSLTATMVNQTKLVAPALVDAVPGVPRGLSDAVVRALAKDPGQRFETCAEFVRAALAEIPGEPSGQAATVLKGKVSRGVLGKARCPACRAILPVAPVHANKRVRCNQCRAISLVEFPREGVALLTLIQLPTEVPKAAPQRPNEERRED